MRTRIVTLALTLASALPACGDDTSGSGGAGATSTADASSSAATGATGSNGATTSTGQGGDPGGGGSPGEGGDPGEGGNPGAGGGGAITRAELIGTWETSCYVETGIYYGKSVKVFTETDTIITYDQYENDPTCSDDSKLFVTSTSMDSAWSLGDVLLGGEVEYDRVNAGCSYTTVTDLATNNWNAGSGCGPFTTGVEVEVSGQTCYGYPVAEIGGTQYDVIFRDPQGIRFGTPTSGNGSTPELRPTLPEPNEKGIFRKQ